MSGEPFECPKCGSAGEFVESSYRSTWQPVTLERTPMGVDAVEYGSFDYADAVFIFAVSCASCEATWPSYDELEQAARGEAHRTGYLPDSEVFPRAHAKLREQIEAVIALLDPNGTGREDEACSLLREIA